MNIVFMGTSVFALPSLSRIISSHYNLRGIVTRPDRPKGRGRTISAPPVKQLAREYDIPILQPVSIKDAATIETIYDWKPDLIIVVSFGQIIPIDVLDCPLSGCINVHPSLLPRYRGPAPIQRALMAGDKVTGVTTMFMDESLDTGDIIMQMPVNIDDDMDYGQLEAVLADKGADLLIDTISVLASGSLPRKKQDDSRATYAGMITREDERIIWQDEAASIYNRIRALSPVPGAYSSLNGTRFKIFSTRVVDENAEGVPGQVLQPSDKGLLIQTGKGILEVLEVQKEGRNRMPCSNFLKGFIVAPGSVLGI